MNRRAAFVVAAVLVACGPPEIPMAAAPVASAPTPESPPSPPPPETVPTAATTATPAPVAELPFVIPPVPAPPVDGRQLRVAPGDLDHVILKISYPPELQFTNLRYEGHNALVGKGAPDGEAVAERWRDLVVGTRAVFLLRDSMWSQQDHPYHREPFALMMPPSWVTVAVALAADKRAIVAPADHPVEDDASWTKIATPELMFGSFPASDSLHREATQPLQGGDADQQRRTRAARLSLRSLAADVEAMRAVAAHGRKAVALAGARRIAESDRRYFGAARRFHRVAPIFVENPNTKELQSEGKGMVPPDPAKLGIVFEPAVVALARDAVYRRRLRDGDMALERYDLSVPAERLRAIQVLEALIPADDPPPGGRVWLWVTGRLDPHRKAEGENATTYLPRFREELKGAAIAHDRLEIVSKPSTEIPPGPGRAKAFRGDARWYRHRDLPYSVRLTASDLAKILAQP